MLKLDLHCHLDGSLPVGYVIEELGKRGQIITAEDLQVEESCPDLAQYLKKFDLPLRCMQTISGLRKSAYEFIKSVAEERVAYVEVRFAPMLSVNEQLPMEQRLNCQEIIGAVLQGLKKGEEDFGVCYGLIVCAMRHHTEEMNLQMIKEAREFLGDGVVAVDLAGNEAAFPMKGFQQIFREVNRLQMPFTVHAGECGSVVNIQDAIDLGAVRIGHGIAMSGHKEVQRLCAKQGIGVEMCPISNMQTKAIKEGEIYPIMEFMDNQVLVTVNTDNRTVSNTNIEKEMQWLKTHSQIRQEQIVQCMKNAIETAFASDEVKQRLWRMI